MLRSPLILFAIPAGIAAGGLGWLAAGGASASIEKLEPLHALAAGLTRPRRTPAEVRPTDIADLTSLPLLLLTTGPGATPLPVVQVDGLVRTRRRRAALISIDDKPTEWMVVGDSHDGVTLQDVASNHVVIETAYGLQDVALGERSAGAPAPPPASSSSPAPPPSAAAPPAGRIAPVGPMTIPPGYRSPPAPASAPRPR